MPTLKLYSGLERLQEQGLVTIEKDNDKTHISLADPERAEQALQELPQDLRQDVAAIIEAYGDLDHATLLKLVYQHYPGYAKKSRRRSTRKRSKWLVNYGNLRYAGSPSRRRW